MNQKNLALYSEYVINHLSCEIIETPLFSILKTPTAPDFYFGNLLALKVPLHQLSREQWQAHFLEIFGDNPEIKHETYTWSRPDDDKNTAVLNEFLADNFGYEENHILSQPRSEFVIPNALNNTIEIREITTEADWSQWVAIGIEDLKKQHSDTSAKSFLLGRKENYQNLARQGYGQYLGAFTEGRLVGYAGLYHFEGIARFQNVLVLDEFQNKKIAKTLLTRLIENCDASVEMLVIHADEHYHATQLYQGLGFKITERECALCWWPDKPIPRVV